MTDDEWPGKTAGWPKPTMYATGGETLYSTDPTRSLAEVARLRTIEVAARNLLAWRNPSWHRANADQYENDLMDALDDPTATKEHLSIVEHMEATIETLTAERDGAMRGAREGTAALTAERDRYRMMYEEASEVAMPRWEDDPVAKANGWNTPDQCGNCGEPNPQVQALTAERDALLERVERLEGLAAAVRIMLEESPPVGEEDGLALWGDRLMRYVRRRMSVDSATTQPTGEKE